MPSSKIMSRWLMPSAVKYDGVYSCELSRTTRPTLRLQKCDKTFLNDVEMLRFCLTAEEVLGRLA